MPMTIYKLFADQAGDSVASLDIQMDGDISALLMTCEARGINALDEGMAAEVSFLSSNTFTNNDTRGSIGMIHIMSGLLTSGMMNANSNIGIPSLDIPVAAGERIHMHIVVFGTLTARSAHCYLYVRDKGTPRIPGRRR